MVEPRSQRHAILARDAAVARLRRLTVAVLATATGIAGVLAGVAASSTHGRAAVRRDAPSTRATTAPAVPVPVPAATIPAAGALAPSSAPVASSAPPIVVSGGS